MCHMYISQQWHSAAAHPSSSSVWCLMIIMVYEHQTSSYVVWYTVFSHVSQVTDMSCLNLVVVVLLVHQWLWTLWRDVRQSLVDITSVEFISDASFILSRHVPQQVKLWWWWWTSYLLLLLNTKHYCGRNTAHLAIIPIQIEFEIKDWSRDTGNKDYFTSCSCSLCPWDWGTSSLAKSSSSSRSASVSQMKSCMLLLPQSFLSQHVSGDRINMIQTAPAPTTTCHFLLLLHQSPVSQQVKWK